jgi:hypothetical protein
MRGDRDRAMGQNGHSFHAVRPDAFNYVWDNTIEPALEVDSGEVVEFTVRDASDEQIQVNSTSEDVAKLESLLKNSFVAFSGPHSGAEERVLVSFEPASGTQIGPAATFATGSPLPRTRVNKGQDC